MNRPIAISLSPNTQKDDVLLALKLILFPHRWLDVKETEEFEKEFSKYFGYGYLSLAINSGRSALYQILKSFGIKNGDEVILQALTCVAVPNSILWLGGKPIYVDVDDSFNLDPDDLSKKISKNTKVIIVQHTFGIPADMDRIMNIAKSRNIPVIEDCALSLGGKYKNKLLGILQTYCQGSACGVSKKTPIFRPPARFSYAAYPE